MIYLTKSNQSKFYIVKDGNQMIGKFFPESGGIIFMNLKEPYRKLNAFGINKKLLFSDDIKFQIVIVKCQGVYYMTRKRTILEEGVEQELNFGVKIFLPIPLCNSTKDKQLKLDFYTEGGNQ